MALFDFSIIRELRKKHDLSIGVLAEKSGVSAPVISKLERNLSKAELDTLYKIARVFHMSCTELLNMAEAGMTSPVTVHSHTSEDFLFRKIRYKNMECLYGQAAEGGKVSRPAIHGDDYEICWVLSGELLLTLPTEKHLLKKDDSIRFDALLEHTYEAKEDCEIILMHIKKEQRS